MYRLTHVNTHTHSAGGIEKWIAGYVAAAELRWLPRTVVLDRETYTFHRSFCGSLLNICVVGQG